MGDVRVLLPDHIPGSLCWNLEFVVRTVMGKSVFLAGIYRCPLLAAEAVGVMLRKHLFFSLHAKRSDRRMNDYIITVTFKSS